MRRYPFAPALPSRSKSPAHPPPQRGRECGRCYGGKRTPKPHVTRSLPHEAGEVGAGEGCGEGRDGC